MGLGGPDMTCIAVKPRGVIREKKKRASGLCPYRAKRAICTRRKTINDTRAALLGLMIAGVLNNSSIKKRTNWLE
jgi:hypothetical protein